MPTRQQGGPPQASMAQRGYADGGYVEPRGYAGGGVARGTDTVPAMLTPGEFVVSRPAVRQIGIPNLRAMNAAGGGTNRPRMGSGRLYAQGGGLASKPFQGANNNFLVDFASDYQRKFDEANAANEARYGQIMEGYGGLHDRVLGGIENLGQDQIAESRRAYDQSLASTNAQMATRGLAGTTVGASIKQGTDRGYQDAVRGIQESAQMRKAGADMSITTGKLGAIERREDIPPDFNNLMMLTQGMASGGYGQGYGGGYGQGYGGPSESFNMNDYFGSSGFNPYESVAAGMLGHSAGSGAAKKTEPWVQRSPTG